MEARYPFLPESEHPSHGGCPIIREQSPVPYSLLHQVGLLVRQPNDEAQVAYELAMEPSYHTCWSPYQHIRPEPQEELMRRVLVEEIHLTLVQRASDSSSAESLVFLGLLPGLGTHGKARSGNLENHEESVLRPWCLRLPSASHRSNCPFSRNFPTLCPSQRPHLR